MPSRKERNRMGRCGVANFSRYAVAFLGFWIVPIAESVTVFGPDMGVLTELKSVWGDNELFSLWTPSTDCGNITGVFCDAGGHVIKLHLSNSRLHGLIPSYISNLTGLTELVLNGNSLSGLIPSSIGYLNNLIHLQLANNYFMGPIPLTISNLVKLETLALNSNQLNGSIPEGIGNLVNLTELKLYDNKFSGIIPAGIQNLVRVEHLLLYNNSLIGPIPPGIGNLVNLNYLGLANNLLNGSIPPSFEKLSKLSQLLLYNNSLSGEIPSYIGKLTAITKLHLQLNSFTGSIPWSFGNLSSLYQVNLGFNKLNGSIPESIQNLTSLQHARLNNNFFTGPIPAAIGTMTNLTSLWLFNNRLSGSIPTSIGNLANMQNLTLNDNKLSGELPESLKNMSVLKVLSVARNELTGPVPAALFHSAELWVLDLSGNYFTGAVPEVVAHNPNISNNCFADQLSTAKSGAAAATAAAARCRAFCSADTALHPCGGAAGWACQTNSSTTTTSCTCDVTLLGANATCPLVSAGGGKKKSASILPAVAGATGGLVLLLLGCLVCFCCLCAKKKPLDEEKGSLFQKEIEGMVLQCFSRHQILTATDNFNPDLIIGKGGYGTVYLAHASDGTPWAVKRVNKVSQDTVAVFENEVKLIASVQHRNLVSLIGYFSDQEEQILVYEFVPNGALNAHIFLQHPDKERPIPLTFQQRLDIARGVAHGITYLHCFAKEPIVHRDIKSANILIDEDFQAKVADFGLSKRMQMRAGKRLTESQVQSSVSSTLRVVGTPGFMDPEYHMTMQVTTKSDVYSFGVVLLELLTGKSAVMVDDVSGDSVSLVRWALPFLRENRAIEIADPVLNSDFPLETFQVMATVAKMCVERYAKDRPTMAKVSTYLDETQGSTAQFSQTGTSQDRTEATSAENEPLDLGAFHNSSIGSSSSSSIMRAPVSRVMGPR